jgi:hypothetical protein
MPPSSGLKWFAAEPFTWRTIFVCTFPYTLKPTITVVTGPSEHMLVNCNIYQAGYSKITT